MHEDNTTVAAHSPSYLQFLMDCFANACTVFGLTISLKKKVFAQATTSTKVTINNYELEVVEQFMYLGSTISNKRVRHTNWYGSPYTCPPRYTCVEKSPTLDQDKGDSV